MKQALQLFNSKSYSADPESGLWPGVTISNQHRTINYGPMINRMLFNDNPMWRSLSGLQSLFDVFHTNPVVYAVIMLKAREYSNMNIRVKSRSKGVVIPPTSKVTTVRKLYSLFESPNPLQSRGEFITQSKVMFEVAGNSFRYANFVDADRNIESLMHMWNVWPQHMQYVQAGGYFEAMSIKDIIRKWKFEAGRYKKEWEPEDILFTNKANTEIMDDLVFGRSPILSLARPISNIDLAYESRNVMMRNRGMRLIFSSGAKDGTGAMPLMPHEVLDIEQRWGGYGMLNGQSQAFFSPYPLNVTPIDQDVRKLGLFEEVANDALIISAGYGVPEILTKLYLTGATFENVEASLRRLYQGTLIPEAEDEMKSWNKFLRLDETDYFLEADFSDVPCLQESEEKREATRTIKSTRFISELQANLISPEEYREQMGYPPLPKKEETEGAIPDSEQDQKTLEAQAELRGSVGGVQGILNLQASVSVGTTTYDAGIAILTIVYGFSKENAEELLGEPKEQEETTNTNTDGNSGTIQEENSGE